MNSYKVIKYLVSDNVGLSSKAIIHQYIDNTHNTNHSYPRDCGDLERCILAVDSLDLYNVKHMESISKEWKAISDNWLKLKQLLVIDRELCYDVLRDCTRGIN